MMRKVIIIFFLAITVLSICLPPALAPASEENAPDAAHGRKTWNTFWRFINFFILAFVVVKYGKAPLLAFLSNYSSEVSERLDNFSNMAHEAEAEYQQTLEKMARIELMIAEIRTIYQNEAERARKRIIDEAEARSEHIMAEAQIAAETSILNARNELKAEMIQAAIERAEKMIRQNIATDDRNRMIRDCLTHLTPA